MPGQEHAFETAIEHHLTMPGGYEKGDLESFDTERGLFVGDVIAFIQKTQPREWEYLAKLQKKTEEPLRYDWTDEEAMGAGWEANIYAMSFADTLRHVMYMRAACGPDRLDLDDFRVRTAFE